MYKNTLFLYIRMFILMGVTLYTSRVLLSQLGEAKYGIYNLIAGVVILFSFVQNSMSTATQRFISFHLGKHEFAVTYSIFYNSKTIHYYLSLLFGVMGETIGLLVIIHVLNIPEELEYSATTLYHIVVANTIILITRIPYQSWIIAHEKMLFFSITSIIEGLLSLSVVFLLPFLPGDNLINYGLLTVSVSIILNMWYALYCHKNYLLRPFHCEYNKTQFRKLVSFSGYTLLGSLSNVGASQGVNLLMNNFFGVLANAAMGIAQQVNGAVQKFVTNFQTAFKPQIVKTYSSGQFGNLLKMIEKTSKLSFFLMWMFACPILMNTECVLQIWLEKVPAYTPELCKLMICCSLLECISSPLWMTIQATGKIRAYQIVISITNISIVLWTYICFCIWDGIYFALIMKFVIDIIVLCERLLFANRLFNFEIKPYLEKVISKIFFVVATSICFCMPIYLTNEKGGGFAHVVAISMTYFFICVICTVVFGLEKNEINTIKNKINEFKNRHFEI